MATVQLRKASPSDVDKLRDISIATFTEAFAGSNTAGNMAQYIGDSFSNKKLSKELNDNNSEFYFAILEDEVIGYLKVNFGHAQTELKDSAALEIERIYVAGEFHGKMVGQLLYEKAVEIAAQQGAHYIWLGVWEENTRAISFYKKNGFVEFDKHIFVLGDDEQTDIMMKKQL